MAEKTYQAGNTVRLSCMFKDHDGSYVDPDLTKVVIYDQRYEKIGEFVLSNANRYSVGQYFYDYTIPSDSRSKVYYEWYGEIGGVPSLKRGSFKTTFI